MNKQIISAGFITSIIILALVFFGSCSKSNSVNASFERKIPGTWYFHKVTINRSFSLGCDNITNEYEGIKLTFNSDHTLQYTEAGGQSFTGNWVLERDYHSTDENSADCYILDVNINNQPNKSFTGTSLSVTNNRINFNQGKSEGTYSVILKKD